MKNVQKNMAFPVSLKFHPQKLVLVCDEKFQENGHRGVGNSPRSCVMDPSFANEMQCDLSRMGRAPMLEKINALPGPQSEAAPHDRYRELHAGQRGADVGRHVVGAFVGVPISAGLLGGQAVKKRVEIGANVRRRVFLYDQARGGMPAKQRQEPSLNGMGLEPILDFARDFNEPAAAC